MSTSGIELSFTVARRHFDVSAKLSVTRGERLVLFGPSGAGKTTVLEAVSGLIPLVTGYVRLDGRSLSEVGPAKRSLPLDERRVGLLRQDPGLFPHLSVARNIGYARRLPPDAPELRALAGELGIGSLLGAMPRTLSGGQRQRVALARVLLSDFAALLLDEPYTGLDAALSRELTDLAVANSREAAAIMVTHDLDIAQSFGHRMGVIDAGRVLQLGDPHEIVLQPASRRVAELVGYRSFVDVDDPGGGAAWIAAVHPDRVVPGSTGEGLPLSGSVNAVRPAGVRYEVEMLLSESGDTVVFLTDTQLRAGEETVVTVLAPPVFDSVGQPVSVDWAALRAR